jgi:hypothetical protein
VPAAFGLLSYRFLILVARQAYALLTGEKLDMPR